MSTLSDTYFEAIPRPKHPTACELESYREDGRAGQVAVRADAAPRGGCVMSADTVFEVLRHHNYSQTHYCVGEGRWTA